MKQKMYEILNILKDTVKLITWDWSTLLLFELMYKFLLLLVSPYMAELFSRAMAAAGIVQLSSQTVPLIFTSPTALLILLSWIILLAFTAYVEITAVLLYCKAYKTAQRWNAFTLFGTSLRKSISLFRGENIAMIPFVFLLIPLSGFSVCFGYLSGLRVPEFVQTLLFQNWYYSAAALGLLTLLYLFLCHRIFSIPGVILDGRSFRDACRRSRFLLEKGKGTTISCLVFWVLLYTAAAVLLYICVLGVLVASAKGFYTAEQAASAYWFSYSKLSALGSVLTSIYIMVCNLGLIATLYQRFYGTRPACVQSAIPTPKEKMKKKVVLLSELCLLLFLTSLYAESAFLADWVQPSGQKTQVVAHRGGALIAPENTLAALNEAKRSGAEFAEVDVQQTNDGALIVMHDTSLNRTVGVKRDVWDMSLNEIKRLGMGSPSSDFGNVAEIPSLEEMLRGAKGRIELMIELKSNNRGKNLEEATIDLIQKHRMQRQCIIGSMDYRILERVKEIAPEIRTVYITAQAYGDFKDATAADMLSVEESSVTVELVESVRQTGKPLYVWTVNREKSMRELVTLGVDGIVTDNPYLAGYVMQTEGREPLADRLFQMFFPTVYATEQ